MDSEKDILTPKQRGSATPLPLPTLEGNERKRPLALIELPVDVLKDIVQHVTHTNDLTNLCLTCRCLRELAIPQIYSRFDIVWPDAATTGDRVGVDALTHGLSTLTNVTRRGNDHARWVKKFSLGNGPAEWVNEYNINKEGGKMLGTLVNLAITRMESLESFSWDMPTGILRDVFMSLHDLNGTLKNLHVRFHDNRETTPPTSQDPSRRVETPTFKGLAGLRTLSVLDIDEPQYLSEMSYAVENSVEKLKELRVGIAVHMGTTHRWIKEWDQLEPASTDGTYNGVGGGVLGMLFSRIVTPPGRRLAWGNGRSSVDTNTTGLGIGDAAVQTAIAVTVASEEPPDASTSPDDDDSTTITTIDASVQPLAPGTTDAPPAGVDDGTSSLDGSFVEVTPPTPPTLLTPTVPQQPEITTEKPTAKSYEPEESLIAKQLKLETLSLERVPLSVSVLVNTKAIDWTCLSNLTIINCFNHDRLWKALRRKFSPYPTPTLSSSLHSNGVNLKHGHIHTPISSHRVRGIHQSLAGSLDYKIRLKKLHTDCVTSQLITFIRDTLPPNSLEILFLQETSNDSTVTMESIYKGAIRRHKGSLKKLLVNSKSHEDTDGMYKWTFKKEHLAFLSSGKMPNLRELGMALEYKEWHYFLTRLPHMQQLRSLYITHIRDTPHLSGFAPRELANQILNTVILRPEVELCYVGILTKCFEILEGPSDDPDLPEPETQAPIAGGASAAVEQDSEDEEESEPEDEDEDEDDLDDDDAADDSESDGGFAEEEKLKTGIRLREILFYDDKVEVFRARNASL
ncbi:hypothetical protein BDD12DRAFT_731834 [Trichophaea hybrida]|nr:hypothetical protein BDD12DRAFT_731834 [Trichophaea hybrida]